MSQSSPAAPSPRLRDEARALAWLFWPYLVGGVITAVYMDIVTSEHFEYDPVLFEGFRVAWMVISLLAIGGLASWAAASGRPLARAAFAAYLTAWGWGLLQSSGLVGELVELDSGSSFALVRVGQVLWTLTEALVAAALVSATVARRRSGLDVALAVAYVLVVAFVNGAGDLLGLDLDASPAVAQALTFAVMGAQTALVLALLYRRRRAALAEAAAPEPAPAAATEEGGAWDRTLGGVRLVRRAEITRVATMAALVVSLLLAVSARSAGLYIGATVLGVLALLGAQVVGVMGLAAYRRLPVETEARGPAAAAFALAVVTLTLTAVFVVWTVVTVVGERLVGGDGGLQAIERYALLAGLGAIVALLWSARRVAAAAAAPALRRRASVGVALYVLAGALGVAAKLRPVVEALDPELMPIVGLGVLAVAIAAVVALLGALTALARAVEDAHWTSAFGDGPEAEGELPR